jgi:hypothetical protein
MESFPWAQAASLPQIHARRLTARDARGHFDLQIADLAPFAVRGMFHPVTS